MAPGPHVHGGLPPGEYLIIVYLGKRTRRISQATQVANAYLYTVLQESLIGQRIVKAFARETYEQGRFSRANWDYFRIRMQLNATRELSPPVMELLGSLGMAGIIFYGGYAVIRGTSTPGHLLLLSGRPPDALPAHQEPERGPKYRPGRPGRGGAGLRPHGPGAGDQGRPRGRHRWRPWPGRSTIPGSVSPTTAGRTSSRTSISPSAGAKWWPWWAPSGAGKSTLLNLLPRFYDATAGAIRIDGQDIREVTLASLRGQIGVVTQQTILFNDSVRHNVAYGRLTATEAEIVKALKAAHAYDFVMALPQGLDTLIGEQGVRLSGGERQRLAIARALLKDPPILILDEATSSLDSESEREVQQALDRLIVGRTTLVIAHRLSTVRNADRIIAMEDGRIVETGSHTELLAADGLYRRLYEMQFAREEDETPPAADAPPTREAREARARWRVRPCGSPRPYLHP